MNGEGYLYLERIAAAFEEQNRITSEWIAQQRDWHEQAEALTEQRFRESREREEALQALYSRVAQRDEAWHENAEALNEQRYQENVAREQAFRDKQVEMLVASFQQEAEKARQA